MIRRVLFTVISVCGVLMALQASAQEVLFTYKFEAGSSERYRVKLSQELDFGGNAINQISDLEVTLKCLSVTDGKAKMEMIFDKADMMREMFGSQSADPLAEALAKHGVTFIVDQTGDVTDVQQSGAYEHWDQVQSFVEPVVKGWYVMLPNKPYAPGATWEDTHKDKSADGTDVTMITHFKYKENKKEDGRDCASVVGDAQTRASGNSVSPMGTFSVDGGGKGKVEYLFDPVAQIVVKLKAKMNVDMTLTPAAGGDNIGTSVTYQLERELL